MTVLESKRYGTIYSPRIGGSEGEGGCRVDVRVNRDVDGAICEVFIDVEHREGTVLVETGHALGRLASLALQSGTPVDTVIRALDGIAGGPAGPVHDCDGVERAESVPDLVAHVLRMASL